jgi:hypothetical protein
MMQKKHADMQAAAGPSSRRMLQRARHGFIRRG